MNSSRNIIIKIYIYRVNKSIIITITIACIGLLIYFTKYQCYKRTLMYSGAEPEFIEGDIFKIIIPPAFGSMTKVSPVTSAVVSAQVGAQVVKSMMP